ncbi:neprilysin-1 [Trichonephila inaurata madagascariensis]|uniref:Neprilysin-1 n=1 Tax=Trichonephila inaurata madagascariensis TaxID=2747483 RepID=A0A8X6X3P1_9ARAC|nr:neprilysin-1 [Trichonephila inaurata madagascariensis]
MVGYEDWILEDKLLDAYYEKLGEIQENNYFDAVVALCGIIADDKFSRWNKTALRNETSINYGAIGTVIGHEISHAFDTTGRKFDHLGNLRQWWTNGTGRKFLQKAECFMDQYDNYEDTLSSVKADGKVTVGENIADNGGVRNAFKAFRLHLALSGENLNYRKRLPGLSASPEQLFFLGYASIWCANMTDKYAKTFNDRDNHSPNKIR